MKNVKTLYLDHQATTPLDSQVFAAMRPYLEQDFGNPHATDHAVGWKAGQAVERAAMRVADLLGCDADEVVFTSGATEANNLALLGLGRHKSNQSRKRILLGATEHKCVLSVGRVLSEQLGCSVTILPVDNYGRIDLNTLEREISEDVLAVSIMAVNNEIGTIQDIQKIANITSSTGSFLHCDAAQAPYAMDTSTLSQHADLISLSAHKMYGPMGIGALYIRREIQKLVEPLVYGGGQQNGLRSGTLPTALCVGLGEASKQAGSEAAIHTRAELARRRDRLFDGLKALPHSLLLNGPPPGVERHPGNANICFEGFSAHDVLGALQPLLAASTGSACTSGVPEPSHVLRAIGLSEFHANSSIRFSLGHQTTDQDVDEAIDLIGETLSGIANAGLRVSA